MKLRLEPRAQVEILTAQQWWIENRSAARELFDVELERAFGLIRSLPGAGQRVTNAGRANVRRVPLGRTRYLLYYAVADEHIDVLALWHSSRGDKPDL